MADKCVRFKLLLWKFIFLGVPSLPCFSGLIHFVWVFMSIIIELLVYSILVAVFRLGFRFQPIIYFVVVILLLGVVLPSYNIPSFSLSQVNIGFLNDEIFFWLGLVTLVVILLSGYVYSSSIGFIGVSSGSTIILSIFILLTLCCIGVFGSFRVFHLYLFYELSLVPIIYIILIGGHYPDRGSRGIAMLAYTAVFSFPFMAFLSLNLLSTGFSSFSTVGGVEMFSWGTSYLLVILALFSFLVKLPMYGLHLWLPIAHVEAPTYGSIILAGLLLKMGGCGLYRLVSSFLVSVEFDSVIFSYLAVSIIIRSLACVVQSDFKRLVAYSSVAHMMVVIFALLGGKFLGFSSFLIIIVGHGLSSPMLFLVVGLVYSLVGTRILILLRGFIIVAPLFSLWMVLCFVLSVPVPPSPSFLGEVQFVASILHSSLSYLTPLFTFIFLGVLYNLIWLSSIFGSFSSSLHSSLHNSFSCLNMLSLFTFFSYSVLFLFNL